MTTVTRLEIADLVGDAFGPEGADRTALLAAATENGAHPAVVNKLHELPDRRFRTMVELWYHIPEVPVE